MLYGKSYEEFRLYLDKQYDEVKVEGHVLSPSRALEMFDYNRFISEYNLWLREIEVKQRKTWKLSSILRNNHEKGYFITT